VSQNVSLSLSASGSRGSECSLDKQPGITLNTEDVGNFEIELDDEVVSGAFESSAKDFFFRLVNFLWV